MFADHVRIVSQKRIRNIILHEKMTHKWELYFNKNGYAYIHFSGQNLKMIILDLVL